MTRARLLWGGLVATTATAALVAAPTVSGILAGLAVIPVD
jgi:hypothetical protein